MPIVTPTTSSFLSSILPKTQTPQQSAQQSTTSRVAQFQNQQLGGVLNNQTPIAGANVSPDTQTQLTGAQQVRAQTLNNIGGSDAHAQTMALLQQAKQNNDAKAAAAAGAVKSNVATQGTAGYANTTGQGYTNNGALDAQRNQVLRTASSYLGGRYVFGGTSHSGIDCSGLVMAVYAQMGFTNLPHNARIQGQIMGQRTSVANLRPGDLVAWNNGSHIAIYAGNGNIIEAANPRVGVVERKLWSSAVYGVRLHLPGE